jgi:hypothetical protein
MAFKGTKKVGTKNWLEEKNSLDRVDKAFIALRAERDKGDKADKAKLEALEKDFEAAQEGAGQFVVPNEMGKLIPPTPPSSGSTSKANASSTPSSASSTRKPASCEKNAACAPTPTPSAK